MTQKLIQSSINKLNARKTQIEHSPLFSANEKTTLIQKIDHRLTELKSQLSFHQKDAS